MSDKTLKIVNDLTLLQELYEDIYSNSCNAYDVLENYDDSDARYLLVANYLSMAHISYTQALSYIAANDLHHNDLEEISPSFKKFKFEFDQVIIKKDNNTSWLYSRHNDLQKAYKYVMDYTKNIIQMQMEVK